MNSPPEQGGAGEHGASPAQPDASQRAARAYRIFFWIAAVFAIVAAVDSWRTKRAQFRRMEMTDVGTFSRLRDVQYNFVIDAYGYKMQGASGNNIDDQIMLFGVYEKDHVYLLRDYLANAKIADPVVIDVGANIGNHSLFLSRHAGHVHAFEPYPPVVERFRANLALNPGITNITLHDVALGDADGVLPFLAPQVDRHGGGTLQFEGEKADPKRTLDVKVVRGDDWLKTREQRPIAVIKIDVEGAEEKVLKGLKDTIAKHRPLLNIEVSPPPHGTIATFEQLQALVPADYGFLALERSLEGALAGRYWLRPLTPEHFKDVQVEVIAYPKEREAAVPKSMVP